MSHLKPRRSLFAGAAGVMFFAAPIIAQKPMGSITGRVISHEHGSPMPGVRIFLLSSRKAVKTDSVGRFVFEKLRAGTHRVEASVIGFAPLTAIVVLTEGETKDIEFRTDTAGAFLPTIFVEGESQPDLVKELTTFERRMEMGTGRFITREQIKQRNPMRIMDMLRFMPGVRVSCTSLACQIRLNTDPSGCGPAVYLDGVQTTQQVLDGTLPTDIQGIELYRGPSETPPELNNERARCGGAIAIWTRRGRSF